MVKITFLVFTAMIAVSSALFCGLLSENSNKQARKAIVNKENIADIVKQLQRISKIDWRNLDNRQILKDLKVKIHGNEKNVAYLVILAKEISKVNWESVRASFLNPQSSVKKEETAKELTKKEDNRTKEANLIEMIFLLNGISETVWTFFGEFIGTGIPKHPTSHVEKPEKCQITINNIRVDLVQIADRLETFSNINLDQFEKEIQNYEKE